MNMMTLPHTNGSAKGMQQTWLKSTVEEFFSTVNWDDRPIEVVKPQQLSEEISSSASTATPAPGGPSLSITLSVSEFFDAFPWEGQPTIAAPIPVQNMVPQETEEGVNDITLDDFSGLF